MNITQFTMEEVRCFAERQEFEIRPLTFLVGENSTGKTTALACFQVLANYLKRGEIDFNSDPYSMRVFRDIVRNSRKTEKVFKLGFTFGGQNEDIECTVEFVEKKGGIEPAVRSVIVKFTDGKIVLNANDKAEVPIRVVCDEKRNYYHVDVYSIFLSQAPFLLLFDRVIFGEDRAKALANYLKKKEKDTGIPWWSIRRGIAAFSISPIRSRPKRTYDPTRLFDDPKGSDVPMQLMRIQATDSRRWEALKGRLAEFGKRSGLFQNIEVTNFGGAMGNPF